MPEPVLDAPQTPTETYADFKHEFDGRAPAAPAGVDVNKHGASETVDDPAAASGEPKSGDGSDPSQRKDKVEERKRAIQREIDGHVARREQAKRDADAEVERLRNLRAGQPPKKEDPAPQAKPASAAPSTFDGSDANDPEPKQADFTDYQQWSDERAAWIGRKEFRKLEHAKTEQLAEANLQRAQEENQRQYKAAVSDFETRGNEYAAEHDDYPDLVAKLKGTKISPETEAFLLWGCQGQEGPQMLHGLMKNPEKLKEIEGLDTPIKRFSSLYAFKYENRIAELESQLATARQTPPASKRSSAPPAGKTLQQGGAAPATTIDNAPSYSKFKDVWDKEGR